MLRIIIAGSRFFEDYNLFESTMFKVLFHLNKEYPQYNILVINKEERLFKINPCSLEIISGMAKGADTLAVRFANKYNLALKEFPADWNNLNVSPCRVITNSYGSYNAKGTETWRYMLLQTMLLEFLFYFGTEKVKVVKI